LSGVVSAVASDCCGVGQTRGRTVRDNSLESEESRFTQSVPQRPPQSAGGFLHSMPGAIADLRSRRRLFFQHFPSGCR